MKLTKSFLYIIIFFTTISISAQQNKKTMKDNLAIATFGNGCFWCTEAIFQQLKGVETVFSGYTGGQVKNPTYNEVCTGISGNAYVILIIYYKKLM